MGHQRDDGMDRDIMGGACFTMHSNFRVFARAIMMLNRVGEELYLEPNGEGLALRALNSTKSAYATFLFSTTFFASCDLRSITTDQYNLCRISAKYLAGQYPIAMNTDEEVDWIRRFCALSAFRSAKSMDKAVLSCRLFINPRADSMLVQLTHTYDVIKSHEISFLDCTTAFRNIVNKTDLTNCIVMPSLTLSNLFAQMRQDTDEVMLCARGDSFMLRNYTSREHEPDNLMKTEAKVALSEFDRYAVTKAVQVNVNLKEFKALVNFAETYQAPISMYFEQPGSPMVIALESDVNFTAELVMATADLDSSFIEPNYGAPLEVESEARSSGSVTLKRPRSTIPPMSLSGDYSVPSANPEHYMDENLPVTPPLPIRGVTSGVILSQMRGRSPSPANINISPVQAGAQAELSTQSGLIGKTRAVSSERNGPNAGVRRSIVEDSILSITRTRTSPPSGGSRVLSSNHTETGGFERARTSSLLLRMPSRSCRNGEADKIPESSTERVEESNAKESVIDRNADVNIGERSELNGAADGSDEEMFPESPSPPPTKSYRRFFLACSQKTLHPSQLFLDKTVIAPNTQPDDELL